MPGSGSTAVRIKYLFAGGAYDVRYSLVHAILGIRSRPAGTAGRQSHGRMDQPNKVVTRVRLTFS